MSHTLNNWFRSSFGLAMLGGVIVWAALPPLDLTPLAWIGPVFWILLIRAEKLPLLDLGKPTVPGQPWWLLLTSVLLFATGMIVTEWFHGRQYKLFWAADTVFWLALTAVFFWAARRWAAHSYRSLWLAYMFFWLADLQWIRLPYWAIGFGWLALGIYFGLYMPVFIGVSRFAVHRLRLPVIVVAPVIWTALELAQAHLLSGMTMGCLEHTQYRWTGLIQISDLTGCYGVTYVMMFVAACFARMLPSPSGSVAGGEGSRGWSFWPLVPAGALMAAVLAYGYWRTAHAETASGLKIALIQGNIDIRLDAPSGLGKVVFEQYQQLTQPIAPKTDLIVWPETVFPIWVTVGPDGVLPPERVEWPRESRDFMTAVAREFGRPMIVGVDRENYGPRGGEIYNCAALITPDGRWFDRPADRYFYDKTHLVPFGEYMPFADWFPWLQYLSPLGNGSSASNRPACFVVKNADLKDVNLIPSICYETVMPHVIRDQLATLRSEGVEPQILVNLTNDGWFWASAELEQHLACSVYRAVENRLPMVIAANTGISAWIDGNGHIVEQAPKHNTDVILADVQLDTRQSWYSLHGDWFAGTCLAITIALAAVGIWTSLRQRRA